jgi:hypothetical protein
MRDRALAEVREQLSPDELERSLAAGRRISLEEACALALTDSSF